MQPGQFFTEYLDMMPKGKRMMSAKDYKIAVEINNDVRRHGIMFALPDYGRLKDRDIKQSFAGNVFKPPYPMCILEFTGEHLPSVPLENKSSKRVVFVYDRGTYADIIPLSYRDIDNAWHPPVFSFRFYYEAPVAVRLTGEGMAALTGFNKVLPDLFDKIEETGFGKSSEKFARAMADDFLDELWAYVDFCRVLNENEVAFEDVEPDAAKNKMRRARGKAPLFTYKVLTIGKPKRKSRHLGGTHASPRSHLRRGYYRTSRNGVRHWVQPCMVKGETDGFVHKDYKVEGTVIERLSHG